MQLLDLLHAIPALASAEATLQKSRYLSLSGVPSPAWATIAGDIQRRLSKPLKRAVAARTSRMKFDVEQIVPAQPGPEAGVVGAAQWAREQAE